MGLDIGIINVTYLERPQGLAYEFAWEMAIEASVSSYMTGEGNNWAPFTQRKALTMLDQFVTDKSLDSAAKGEILQWLRSLPWDGWHDDLDISVVPSCVEDDYNPVLDRQDGHDGGLIELHFNW